APAREGPVDVGGVSLAVHRECVGIGPELRADEPPVLAHVGRVVTRHQPDVERLEGAVADAVLARGEDDLVGAGSLPAEEGQGSISSLAAASSEARPSSSPLSLRRRSSVRISPTRGDSPRPSSARSAPLTSSRTSRRRSKYASSGSRPASASANSGASGAYGSAAATTSAGEAPSSRRSTSFGPTVTAAATCSTSRRRTFR